MELVPPSSRLREAFLAMAEESRAAGEDRYAPALTDFGAYLQKVADQADQAKCPLGFVAQDSFWLVDAGGTVLGSCRLRHRLVPHLEKEGGHIGYDIRPGARRRGYGTRILTLALDEARHRGIERVLVTCDDDNVGSVRIIERNGGTPIGTTISDRSGKVVRRYWIDLT